jgi:hypothetical protein
MKLGKWTLALTFISVLSACAPIPDAPNFTRGLIALEEKNYLVAYRFFEDVRSDELEKVKALINKNPQIIEAGLESFSIPSLNESINRYGKPISAEIELKRITHFKRYAAAEQYQVAENNINQVYGEELAIYTKKIEHKNLVDSLSKEERAIYYENQYKQYQESIKITGRVMSSQLINRSNSGTNAGSMVGAAFGQAVYIDSVNFRNYSAGNQLAAGLIGAVIGSSFDQKKTEIYQKVYFIKKKDSSIVRLDQNTSDQVLFPVGACIYYKEPFEFSIIDDKSCE